MHTFLRLRLRKADRLTGLAGPARFRTASEHALARGARTGRHSAVLLLDVNRFTEGDRILVELAEVLRSCVPAGGLSCRLGGDRFAVVLPDLAFAEQAHDVAGAIASALAPVIVDGRLTPLSAGIGLAVAAPGELTHDELVDRAELAMHRAKRRAPETRWAVWQDDVSRRDAA